jgi:hypothetical protein
MIVILIPQDSIPQGYNRDLNKMFIKYRAILSGLQIPLSIVKIKSNA